MSQTVRADSPTRSSIDDDFFSSAGTLDRSEVTPPERISGAIARAVRKSSSARERSEPLPNVRSRLRADRARAIAQRDLAIRKAQRLQRQLEDVSADLVAVLARAEAAERAALHSDN